MDLQVASEKETKRGRDEQEKVVKQWERDPESESERDDEGSKQRLRVEEPDRRSSGGPSKKLLGDSQLSNQGIRRESREIYRRISDDSTHPPSEDLGPKQEKKPAEAARGEVQKLEKTKEEEKPKA